MFQFIASHQLDDEAIISVNAGTNWADKFNFIEIKPDINELSVLGVLLKARSQAYQGGNSTSEIFDREGFRPIIFSIKQLPFDKKSSADPIKGDVLSKWVHLAKEWYFDCHKLLNGTVVLHGSSEYLPVGDNIMFDAGLINVTSNYNGASTTQNKVYVLAHIETVANSFSVHSDGTRSFQTTIQFVRGILVNEQKQIVGEGTIDSLASTLSKSSSRNGRTVLSAANNPPEEEDNER